MIRLALPAGDLRRDLSDLLAAGGIHVNGYGEGSRTYLLGVKDRDEIRVRVFREKDIPAQVASGNYDLGVCNLSWVEEMKVRFPEQPLVTVRDVGIGAYAVYAAGPAGSGSLADLSLFGPLRIAGEYPNLAESFAMAGRFPLYRVQGTWGAAEAYPPEDADLAIIAAPNEDFVRAQGLQPLFCLLESSAWLIANAGSLARKDLSLVLSAFSRSPLPGNGQRPALKLPPPLPGFRRPANRRGERESIRLAVPDGHQRQHVVQALHDAGLTFDGYDSVLCLRRPSSCLPGLEVKVIRPHDMAQLVAAGEIDLAITGRDCLMEHLYKFPSSPVREILDLQRGQFNLSAVVTQDLPADNISEAMAYWRSKGKRVLRVASEFPAIADHYARSRHLWRYQVIPIAGASEGYVPEDAELLIEGTETGRTLLENKLKPIDLLFRSTTCLIARSDCSLSQARRAIFDSVVEALTTSVQAPQRA